MAVVVVPDKSKASATCAAPPGHDQQHATATVCSIVGKHSDTLRQNCTCDYGRQAVMTDHSIYLQPHLWIRPRLHPLRERRQRTR